MGYKPIHTFQACSFNHSDTSPKIPCSRDDGGDPNQPYLVHEAEATVAPFRAWRGSQHVVARGPEWVTIDLGRRILSELTPEV